VTTSRRGGRDGQAEREGEGHSALTPAVIVRGKRKRICAHAEDHGGGCRERAIQPSPLTLAPPSAGSRVHRRSLWSTCNCACRTLPTHAPASASAACGCASRRHGETSVPTYAHFFSRQSLAICTGERGEGDHSPWRISCGRIGRRASGMFTRCPPRGVMPGNDEITLCLREGMPGEPMRWRDRM